MNKQLTRIIMNYCKVDDNNKHLNMAMNDMLMREIEHLKKRNEVIHTLMDEINELKMQKPIVINY